MMRILLFVATNLAVVLVASITLSLFGFNGFMAANGVDLNLSSLLVWGCIGVVALAQSGRLRRAAAAGLMALFVFVIVLTASRMAQSPVDAPVANNRGQSRLSQHSPRLSQACSEALS